MFGYGGSLDFIGMEVIINGENNLIGIMQLNNPDPLGFLDPSNK
jgi:hypothetical protein